MFLMRAFSHHLSRFKAPQFLHRFYSTRATTQPKHHDWRFLDDVFAPSATRLPRANANPTPCKFDLILLKISDPGSRVLVDRVCQSAETIICADGGANALSKLDIVPEAIVGDLDSVEPQVLDRLVQRGARKVLVEEQSTNDMDKALSHLLSLDTPSRHVLCWGAFGDRFDQEMQALNVLHRHKEASSSDKQVLLMTHGNFAVLLDAGTHRIQCAQLQGPYCSLIPMGAKRTVSSKGLLYDLDRDILEFGGLVSTSNGFKQAEKSVEIETDGLLVFHTSCVHVHQED